MEQDTSSAVAEAVECMNGCGSDDSVRSAFAFVRTNLTASYVVKKAPADDSQCVTLASKPIAFPFPQ